MSAARRIHALLREHALSMPEAWEDFPWGESVAKVRKKVFVFMGKSDKPGGAGICVMIPELLDDALSMPNAELAGYGLGKSGWVAFTLGGDDNTPIDTYKAWIEQSYRNVAPKKLSRLLDAQ